MAMRARWRREPAIGFTYHRTANRRVGHPASFQMAAPRPPQDEEFCSAINILAHAEERPKGASRRTHPAGLRLLRAKPMVTTTVLASTITVGL
jgi:hypothetical protein